MISKLDRGLGGISLTEGMGGAPIRRRCERRSTHHPPLPGHQPLITATLCSDDSGDGCTSIEACSFCTPECRLGVTSRRSVQSRERPAYPSKLTRTLVV